MQSFAVRLLPTLTLAPTLPVQSFAVRLLRAQLDRPQRELQTDGTAAQVAPYLPCTSRTSPAHLPHFSRVPPPRRSQR